MASSECPTVVVRACTPKDVKAMAEIDVAAFGVHHGWSQSEFRRVMGARNRDALVAEVDTGVAAFAVLEASVGVLQVVRLVVAPAVRRQGVGKAVVAFVMAQLRQSGPVSAVADVRESDLGTQLFMRACGWRCTSTHPDHFSAPTEAAYRFERYVPPPSVLAGQAG